MSHAADAASVKQANWTCVLARLAALEARIKLLEENSGETHDSGD